MKEKQQSSADEARTKRYIYMTETPVPKLVCELSVPTIISMLVSSLYNMADTFFVGRISTAATAAVGISFSVMSIIQALGFFCGHGSGNYVSRKLGAGDTSEASEMAATGFVLSFLLGLTFSATGLLLLDPLVRLLGATDTIIPDAKAYLRFILIGAPFMCSQLVINNQLRFQGSAAYAMVGLVSGAVINIGLDPIFIFRLHMGVAGAALATILSQLISFCILFIGTYQGPNIHLHIKNARFTRHYFLEIVNGGFPSLARQGLNAVSTMVLNTTAGLIGGEAAIAGMSVVTRVMMLSYAALIGFGQGFQPVVSFNYGAGLYRRVKDAFWFCVKYGTILLSIFAVVSLGFAPAIIRFFRDDPDVVAIGTVALRFQNLVFPLAATSVMSSMMLQSSGSGVKASILSAARSGLFLIPFVLIFSHFFGMLGLEFAQAVADACTFLITIPITISFFREMDQKSTEP